MGLAKSLMRCYVISYNLFDVKILFMLFLPHGGLLTNLFYIELSIFTY
jgi:hypothetical protein